MSAAPARPQVRVLAIDPGPVQSAWLRLDDPASGDFGIWPNDHLLRSVRTLVGSLINPIDVVVIEQIESFGMAVGREVFETVRWAGRFEEAAQPTPVVLLPRKAVKMALCGSLRAKDANIRAALIDRFGGPASTRKGGALYGVSRDVWSALALAVTYLETREAAA